MSHSLERNVDQVLIGTAIVSAVACIGFVAFLVTGYLKVKPDAVEAIQQLSGDMNAVTSYVESILDKSLRTFGVIGGVLLYINVRFIELVWKQTRSTTGEIP